MLMRKHRIVFVQALISFAISSRSSCKSSSLILSVSEGISVLHSSALSQQSEPGRTSAALFLPEKPDHPLLLPPGELYSY